MKSLSLALRLGGALLLLSSFCPTQALAQNPYILAPKAALSTFQINPASLIGGKSAVGTLTLDNPAPAGGATVTITSNNLAVQPTRSVRIAAGTKTLPVPINTALVKSDVAAILSATYNGVTKTAALAVHPTPAVLINLSADAQEAVGGTGSHTGTVLLNGKAAAGGAVITLHSDNSAVTMPSSVTVPAGQTSANFSFTPNIVAHGVSVTLTAALNGVLRPAHFIVRPVDPTPLTVALFAADVYAGETGYLSITLSRLSTDPVVVTLTVDDPAALSLSTQETIPPGYDNLQIPYHAAMVTKTVAVNISASIPGSSNATGIVIYAPNL